MFSQRLYVSTYQRGMEGLRFQFETLEKTDNPLRTQIATSNEGGTGYLPYAFTEQGVAMLSGILNSERASI